MSSFIMPKKPSPDDKCLECGETKDVKLYDIPIYDAYNDDKVIRHEKWPLCPKHAREILKSKISSTNKYFKNTQDVD